jgi:hypothetical protein
MEELPDQFIERIKESRQEPAQLQRVLRIEKRVNN